MFQPPIDGKLVHGFEGAKVGDRLRVRLVRVDVEQGSIDFQRVQTSALNGYAERDCEGEDTAV